MQSTKPPLTTWFLAICLISQAKTGLSALALKRHLGVSYPIAWRIHHKLMQAMAERETRYVLEGQVQVDDAYLGGERSGGKVGAREFALATAFSELGACLCDLAPLPSRPTWESAYSNGMIPSLLRIGRGAWCGTLGMRQRLKPIGETRSKGFETVSVGQGI